MVSTEVEIPVGYLYFTCWTIGVQFSAGATTGYFLFYLASRPALGTTQPPIQWVTGAFTLGIKQSGLEVDYSPPPSAKVKNVWSYTSIPNTSSRSAA
jgi:hypothetical protein